MVDRLNQDHRFNLAACGDAVASGAAIAGASLPPALHAELASQLAAFNALAHEALADLLRSVPTGAGALFSALAESLPHKSRALAFKDG